MVNVEKPRKYEKGRIVDGDDESKGRSIIQIPPDKVRETINQLRNR